MASQPLKAEALPALETLRLEGVAQTRRTHGFGSWARGALLLDGLMLLTAALLSELTAARAGIVQTAPLWLGVYSVLVLALLARRGLYNWRLRLSVLDNLKRVVSAAVLASMALLALRILLPGDV